MSYAKFDSNYVQGYIANKTPFETAMQDVKNVFGLTLPTDPTAASAGKLLLTDYEAENLRKAYERTLQAVSYTHLIDSTAQFPPDGLSTVPAAAARHLRCQNAR